MMLSESHCSSDALELLLQEQKILPTALEISQAAEALKVLKLALLGDHEATQTSPTAYTSTSQGVTLMLVPIGAYGLDCWDSGAEIPCCIAGTPSEKIFYSIAHRRLRRAAGQGVTILKSSKSANTMFEIDIGGVRFTLQYHQSRLISSGAEFLNVPDQLSGMPYIAKLRFNAFRDTLYLSSIIQHHESFRLSYYAIKLWAIRHGLLSTRFGYLHETQLLMMLAKVYSLRETTLLEDLEQLVVTFFEYYSKFNYEQEVIMIPSRPASETPERRAYGPGMAVLTYHAPVINASNVKSNLALRIIKSEFINTLEHIRKGTWNWASIVNGPKQSEPSTLSFLGAPAAQRFLTYFPSYLKIDVSYWGTSTIEVAEFFAWIDMEVSTFGNKLNDMIPSVTPRAWPTKFVDCSEVDPSKPAQHRAFYLLGLKPLQGDIDTDTVSPAVDWFLTRIHADSRYDTSNSWMGISIPTSSELLASPLVDDTKDWVLLPEEASSKDASDDDDDDDDDAVEEGSVGTPSQAPRHTNAQPTPLSNPSHHQPPTTAPSRPPLRPALDILHRIRHDPSLDPSNYIIGYEDRHAGIMEIPLSAWKAADSTDDEFIPQTRIVYYKRKGDGVKVWDRRERVDLVFGSGGSGGRGGG